MITLNDIKKCQFDENKATFAYSKDKFVLEILTKNNSIVAFKYDDLEKLQEDMTKINSMTGNQILYG